MANKPPLERSMPSGKATAPLVLNPGAKGDRGSSGGKGPTEQSERANRSRFAGTGVYKGRGDTGGPMPKGRATAPLVLNPGGKK